MIFRDYLKHKCHISLELVFQVFAIEYISFQLNLYRTQTQGASFLQFEPELCTAKAKKYGTMADSHPNFWAINQLDAQNTLFCFCSVSLPNSVNL